MVGVPPCIFLLTGTTEYGRKTAPKLDRDYVQANSTSALVPCSGRDVPKPVEWCDKALCPRGTASVGRGLRPSRCSIAYMKLQGACVRLVLHALSHFGELSTCD